MGFQFGYLFELNHRSCMSIILTDTQEPSFPDCPDLIFNTSRGLPTAYVTYDRPVATDNVGVPSVNCDGVAVDGEILPVGVFKVECFAIDDALLVGNCLFNITVEGNINIFVYTFIFPSKFSRFLFVKSCNECGSTNRQWELKTFVKTWQWP